MESSAEKAADNGEVVDSAPQMFGDRTTANAVTSVMGSTTVTTDDADMIVATLKGHLGMQDILQSGADTFRVQDIKEFLLKDELMRAGTWSVSAQTPATIRTATEVAFPSEVLNRVPYLHKAKGHLGFRATTVFTLKINATRFQQGLWKLVWVPSGGNYSSTAEQRRWNISHSCSPFQISQLPGAEFDFSCDTSVTLKIPFISAYNSFPMWSLPNAPLADLGTVFVYPYIPLAAGSSSDTVSYSLFAHFEDVELLGPAYTQMSTQVTRRKRSAQDQEANDDSAGPVSSALSNISLASKYASRVPGLSALFGPVEWASNILANTASSFGFSRPQVEELPSVMTRQILPSMIHVDRKDTSQVLSPFQAHKTTIVPGFAGSNIDEMAFDFLKRKRSYFATGSWSTSTPRGSAIFSVNVQPYTPNISTYPTLQPGVAFQMHTPLSWLSFPFVYWRGSIEYTIKFAKTEFHSGRLMAAFFPFSPEFAPTLAYALADSMYVHREIIDIRDKSEFTIRIPYMSVKQYTNIHGSYAFTGQLTIYVLDELIAPDTVSSTITYNAEIAGGPDFEYNGTLDHMSPPTNAKVPCLTAVTQMSTTRVNVCKAVDEPIGRATVDSNDLANASACMGDRITSICQFLKRYYTVKVNDSYSVYRTYNTITVPYPQLACSWDANPIAPTFMVDVKHNHWLVPFGMMRGGHRIKVIQDPGVALQSDLWQAECQEQLTGLLALTTTNTTTTTYNDFTPFVVGRSELNGGIEVQVPYYNRNPSIPISASSIASTGTNITRKFQSAINASSNQLVTTIRTSGAGNKVTMASYADDFQLGLFISILPYAGELNGVIADFPPP